MTAAAPPKVSAPPDPPPRGLICRDSRWHVRIAGFGKPRELTCWNGHPLNGKRNQRKPIEGVVPCGFQIDRNTPDSESCKALLYVYRIRAGRFFAMDITAEEDDQIELKNMDFDEIAEYFGLDFARKR